MKVEAAEWVPAAPRSTTSPEAERRKVRAVHRAVKA
ncbi:hypothetical protein NK6_9393 [Bradyrhizobium diazoefficiens]|uniref:Uncharacterized protein n=1 Tax=Bradyrhizobium diazoefficiens TaxID=1355477 RepID=A0A0E4BXL4_9BRAD|nr:hypothetical protein NK6_9393 [Bradyrhizobium diazoefficiens]